MENKRSIRVMVVDDHDIVRDGINLMIDTSEDFVRAGEAKNAEMAILVCDKEQPDVILMDLVLPDNDGIYATKEILRKHPDTRVIALTTFNTDGMVERALKAGATSYLKKNISLSDLADAIRAAYEGKPTLSPEATQELIAATVRPPKPGHDLTSRENEVLELLVEGLNNKQIADRLVISPATVKHHVSGVLSKLQANNRAEAVAIAMEYGIIDVANHS